MNVSYWLNTAWMWQCQSEARRFQAATRNVAAEQAAVLARIVRDNRDTDFGKRHGFSSIGNPREYQNNVAVRSYEQLATDVERISAGESGVLTTERVLMLQPTSGTTAGEKLIPYTAALRSAYQRGVSAWIGNLFQQRPAVRGGTAYWSISPASQTLRTTAGGVPIGFDDDTAYLAGWQRWIVRRLLAVPQEVARIPSIALFRYATLLKLLAANDLALSSVWNPTFLLALVSELDNWSDRLCHDLQQGTFSPPLQLDPRIPRQLLRSLRPNRQRAEQVRQALRAPGNLAAIWPRLALISCWTDAAASSHADQLRTVFPRVEIQPKGLLATEGCISIPLVDKPGAALAVRSHFLEFQPLSDEFAVDATEQCRLAHELELRRRYRVVLTTGGGLYRYSLGDVIQVSGFEHQCPLVRFVGKTDRVSDLVGEKLAEPHVHRILEQLFVSHQFRPRFALLAPCDQPPRHYTLFLQCDANARTHLDIAKCRDELEKRLSENPHYRYAVALGQLFPVKISLLNPHGEPATAIFERICLSRGQRLGDIKPAVLDKQTGWAEAFAESIQTSAATQRL